MEVKKGVDQLLASDLPPLVKVERMTEMLLKAGLAYRQVLKPAQVLVHPSNKAGQMLSMRDVWVKGHKMYTVGFRKELLTSSYCFEMSLSAEMRAKQLQANAALNEHGGLAAVTGKERFLSVSSSHTTAWLKAMGQACEPPEPELSVPLTQGDAKSEAIMDAMSNGWQWLVLNASVEMTWPKMPSWLAMSLNASNNNARAMSEVECAAQLAQDLSLGVPLQDAMEDVKKCDPSCLRSLPHIGDFVCKYGGGEQMPLIKFLARFSASVSLSCSSCVPGKVYGTIMVGEEIMRAMTAFEVQGELLPFLRIAMRLACKVQEPFLAEKHVFVSFVGS